MLPASLRPRLFFATQRQRYIYQNLFRKHRHSCRALHWTSSSAQEKRFEVFLDAGNLEGTRVLDIGCGFADFLSFLKKQKIQVHYTGVDIVAEFVVLAQKRHPNSLFLHRNILSHPLREKFDYVFSSGLYAFGNQAFFECMLSTAFGLAKEAYAFNLFRPYEAPFFDLPLTEARRLSTKLAPREIQIKEFKLFPLHGHSES
jgi:SAM-dependent methyltransferase